MVVRVPLTQQLAKNFFMVKVLKIFTFRISTKSKRMDYCHSPGKQYTKDEIIAMYLTRYDFVIMQ